MLLKGFGVIAVFAASSLFGYSLSREYLTRIKNLEQIKKVMILLKGEIQHNNSGISEAILNVATRVENVMGVFLKAVWKKFNDSGCSVKEAWHMGICEVLEKETCLNKEDITIIKELGNNLGITDRETQINSMLNIMDIIELKIKELNETRGEKCKLYRTLGVMAGAFMVVVLI